MKSITAIVLSFCAITLLGGCATPVPQGALFTQVTLPSAATANNVQGSKTGTSTSYSYLGMIAIGDSSIDTAKKAGGITKVTHVDFAAENILGAYGKYTTTVYGE